MSLYGVRQLRRLVIRYSDYDGSSKGMRVWIQKNLVKFAENNPALTVQVQLRRNRHPNLTGFYVNGNVKSIGVKNLEPNDINDQVFHLRNQVGRKMNSTGYKKPVVSKSPSVQGEWHERMNLLSLPAFEIIHK